MTLFVAALGAATTLPFRFEVAIAKTGRYIILALATAGVVGVTD